ncbi:MAG: hypothetical protein ACRDCW_02510 [Sarcina sp.]
MRLERLIRQTRSATEEFVSSIAEKLTYTVERDNITVEKAIENEPSIKSMANMFESMIFGKDIKETLERRIANEIHKKMGNWEEII